MLGQWQSATWQEYVWYRNTLESDRFRLFFYEGSLLITDMGWEGIDHATICDLFTLVFGFWFSAHPQQTASSLGRCLLERSNQTAGAPDLVLYLGENYPRWQPGEPRRIDLNQWRVPDLVGEISDTTLAIDLDEKKHLYEALGIPEYWVVDVRGQRVFAFLLQADGKYQPCETISGAGRSANFSAGTKRWFVYKLKVIFKQFSGSASISTQQMIS